ncbi:hypothetical protein [Anabaena sp. CCY 9402-a]|uniref:hypothetical protein n=1 Tax=Anabaena sp. CCY 9402-a TaxID=3103867 RepID=UPI0039C6640B
MPCPESFITVEINHYHHEVYAGKTLIAYITYDNSEFVTQPWVVMVCGEEKFCHAANNAVSEVTVSKFNYFNLAFFCCGENLSLAA